MKRMFFLSVILVVIVACKREPLITYNTPDNIFFYYKLSTGHYYNDSMDVPFAIRSANLRDTTLSIPLGVSGTPAAFDRSYSVVADPASSAVEGIHYELPDLKIHAGVVKDTLRLLLKRAADLTAGKKKLILRLQPNEYFQTDLRYWKSSTRDSVPMLQFTVTVSDLLEAGPYWQSVYTRFFGKFSKKKMYLINERLGMPLDFWYDPVLTTNGRGLATYYAAITARYLAEQADLGNTIIDEDGFPMKMGVAFP